MNKDDGMSIIVDVDGVIADKNHRGDYSKAGPLWHGIKQVNKLYELGYHITLFTARYGCRENGNTNRQYQRGYIELIDWLSQYGVRYDCVFMGKPAGVLYIDDKASRVDSDSEEGWQDVWSQVKKLKDKDRYGNKKD